MSRIIVADAGSLIGLARIDRLSILTSLYGSVMVPETVLAELRTDSDQPGSRVLSEAVAAGAINPRALPQAARRSWRICV